MRQSISAQKFLDGKANRYGAFVTYGVACVCNHFTEEAQAIFKATAIFIGSLIVTIKQEMLQQRHVMTGIYIDDIEASTFRPQCGIAMPFAKLSNVAFIHRARLHRIFHIDHDVGWTNG